MLVPQSLADWHERVARGRLQTVTQLDRDNTLIALEQASPSEHELTDASFEACAFERVTLHGISLRDTVFDRCVFKSCDLSNMRPQQAAFDQVLFEDCRLSGVDWSNVGIRFRPRFVRCDLRYASFSNQRLKDVVFDDCRIHQAQFFKCNLANVDFGTSDLSGSTFTSCDLRDADLSQAVGVSLDPSANTLGNTKVSVEALMAWASSQGLVIR